MAMTQKQASAAYDILVADAVAIEDERDSFVHYVTHGGTEYRFQGVFGFGGKFRPTTMTVDYYEDDVTPERDAIMVQVNRKLAEIAKP